MGIGLALNCGAQEAKQDEFRVRPEFKVTKLDFRTINNPTVDDLSFMLPWRPDHLPAIFGEKFSVVAGQVHSVLEGPDGRVYFFCGDGRASITRPEGGVVHVPPEGALLRCEADGSHLEVFCRGLRDTKHLRAAFDNVGNLFACDAGSGSDGGGRWLYLVEHGDYGWRTGWPQSALGPKRDPWMAEKLWSARFDGQAAWVLPPVANLTTAGPWPLAHYPGTGFVERYDDHFFVGSLSARAIFSWAMRANGAGFLLLDQQEVVGNVEVHGLTFPGYHPLGGFPDKGLVFATKDRFWDLSPAMEVPDSQLDEAIRLLNGEITQKAPLEWEGLLKSPDQRVRTEAEWRLAASPDGEPLLREAALSPNGGPMPPIARLHGIWGLGIVARRAEAKTPGAGAKMLEPLVPLLEDDDLEVRAQAAQVLGDSNVESAFDGLIKALRNPEERVGMFAAEALGKLGRPEALPQLMLMMRESGDHDPNLRHAYVDALVGLHDDAALQQAARHESPAVRKVALLAMRELHRPQIAQFLHDDEPALVREAACAIHDGNIGEAMRQLAALIEKPAVDEALMCRVLNANFRIGQPANAAALATFAAREDQAEVLRIDALKLLNWWHHPAPNDYVTGALQTLPERDTAPVSEAVNSVLPALQKEAKSPAFKQALDAVILVSSNGTPNSAK
jgi:quinoprotein glucose dehydrogenase